MNTSMASVEEEKMVSGSKPRGDGWSQGEDLSRIISFPLLGDRDRSQMTRQGKREKKKDKSQLKTLADFLASLLDYLDFMVFCIVHY